MDRGKEVAQIHAQDNAFAGTRGGEGLDGAGLHESVCSGVGWDSLKNARKNPLLDMFEVELGSLDEADVAGIFAEDAVVIVGEGSVDPRGLTGAEAFAVGEPFQFTRRDAQPLG